MKESDGNVAFFRAIHISHTFSVSDLTPTMDAGRWFFCTGKEGDPENE
ncbi:MAG: hypothetical protein ACYCRE_10715 [Acidobacteriaceae bacterium]